VKRYKKTYYELRIEGDGGEFDYFVIPPDDVDNPYDAFRKSSAIFAAHRLGSGWVVKVTEEIVYC
jgi:hypothetical protein